MSVKPHLDRLAHLIEIADDRRRDVAFQLYASMINLGGFIAPNVISQIKKVTGSFSGGLLFLAGALDRMGWKRIYGDKTAVVWQNLSAPAPLIPAKAGTKSGS